MHMSVLSRVHAHENGKGVVVWCGVVWCCGGDSHLRAYNALCARRCECAVFVHCLRCVCTHREPMGMLGHHGAAWLAAWRLSLELAAWSLELG
jgi:hypothetical protein